MSESDKPKAPPKVPPKPGAFPPPKPPPPRKDAKPPVPKPVVETVELADLVELAADDALLAPPAAPPAPPAAPPAPSAPPPGRAERSAAGVDALLLASEAPSIPPRDPPPPAAASPEPPEPPTPAPHAPAPSQPPSQRPGPIASPLAPPRGLWLVDLLDWAQARRVRAWNFIQEKTKGKPRWFLPVLSGGSALVLLILVLAAGKMACGSSKPVPVVAASAAPTESSAANVAAVTAQPSASEAASQAAATPGPPARIACSLSGPERRIGAKARAASGVEVTGLGDAIAVGFAATPHDATLEVVDAATLATKRAMHARARDAIRRVVALERTPTPSGHTADAVIALDVDRSGDPLHGRRTLEGDPAIDVGATDDGFGWAPHHGDKEAIKLWPLPEAGKPVEAVRGDLLPDGKSHVVAFRQGGVVYAGAFGGTPPAPLGALVRMEGLGPTGGSPAVAASGDRILVAWSDRAADADPWQLRLASFAVGDASAHVMSFTAPAGGLGEQAMSPDLTPLGAGHFLLVWTEGRATHQVRGAVVGADGSPKDAFVISPDGVDAGQGQSAVLADGRGVVAFLSSTPKDDYEVAAVPLVCTEQH